MNLTTQNRCINIARALCPTNRDLRTAHVAFLLKKNRIKVIGWNKRKSHPINSRHPYHEGKVWLHAEADVILKSYTEDYSGSTLVVVRINRNGQLAMSKPCIGCSSLIKQVGITDVWYSTSEGIFKL